MINLIIQAKELLKIQNQWGELGQKPALIKVENAK